MLHDDNNFDENDRDSDSYDSRTRKKYTVSCSVDRKGISLIGILMSKTKQHLLFRRRSGVSILTEEAFRTKV